MGNAGSFATSKRSLVVGVSKPHEAVYILDTETLRESHAPLLDVCVDPRTSIPVFALSERMLAFTTSIPPIMEGADGIGSIVTAASTRSAHAPVEQHDSLLRRRPKSAAALLAGYGQGSSSVPKRRHLLRAGLQGVRQLKEAPSGGLSAALSIQRSRQWFLTVQMSMKRRSKFSAARLRLE